MAERSLFLWNNEAVVGLVAQHRGAVVPAVLPALERNARSHWNPAVHGLTVNVRKMFQEMDAQLYEQCRQRFEHEEVRTVGCAENPQWNFCWNFRCMSCCSCMSSEFPLHVLLQLHE